MTATPTAITDILEWQRTHQGQVEYSETASTRLLSDSAHLLTPTDCSGMAARMFAHFAGLDIGTYTGNECAYGQSVTTDKVAAAAGEGMLPGDCVLFDWDGGNWDHIAIYAGDGRIWNHGGPGNGPLDWSLAQSVGWAEKVMVRRFLPWTDQTKPESGDNMDTAQIEAIATKAAQQVVENAMTALRTGDSTGHWTGDGADAGFNDRITRLEHLAGITKTGADKPAPAHSNHPDHKQ